MCLFAGALKIPAAVVDSRDFSGDASVPVASTTRVIAARTRSTAIPIGGLTALDTVTVLGTGRAAFVIPRLTNAVSAARTTGSTAGAVIRAGIAVLSTRANTILGAGVDALAGGGLAGHAATTCCSILA